MIHTLQPTFGHGVGGAKLVRPCLDLPWFTSYSSRGKAFTYLSLFVWRMRVTGCSLSTLSGRSWRHLQTSVYELVYRNCGELLAVIIGSLLLLQHVSFLALVCRSLGQHVDLLTSATISNWTATNIGGIAPLDSRVDPVGAVLVVVVVLLGRVDPPEWLERRTIWLAAATTAAVIGALLFIFVVALFHLHFDNWTGVHNFFPSGLRGVRLHSVFNNKFTCCCDSPSYCVPALYMLSHYRVLCEVLPCAK